MSNINWIEEKKIDENGKPYSLFRAELGKGPRLGNILTHDSRDKDYLITKRDVRRIEASSKTWPIGKILNQGPNGACVGFACAHAANAGPQTRHKYRYEDGMAIYAEARRLDGYGDIYLDRGTTLHGGAKALRNRGVIKRFVHIDYQLDNYSKRNNDLKLMIHWLSTQGPLLLGLGWYYDMYFPNKKGFARAAGEIVGGHAILITGWDNDKKAFTCQNSWGPDWGQSGLFYIRVSQMRKILKDWPQVTALVKTQP